MCPSAKRTQCQHFDVTIYYRQALEYADDTNTQQQGSLCAQLLMTAHTDALVTCQLHAVQWGKGHLVACISRMKTTHKGHVKHLISLIYLVPWKSASGLFNWWRVQRIQIEPIPPAISTAKSDKEIRTIPDQPGRAEPPYDIHLVETAGRPLEVAVSCYSCHGWP